MSDEFDFSHPEDVLIHIHWLSYEKPYGPPVWANWEVIEAHVITQPRADGKNVIGAATYEMHYGGDLEYTIETFIDPPGESGYFVVEDVTGVYIRGDGWTTDDDMNFYCGQVRPATPEEISQFC